jgi:hypothetical protein
LIQFSFSEDALNLQNVVLNATEIQKGSNFSGIAIISNESDANTIGSFKVSIGAVDYFTINNINVDANSQKTISFATNNFYSAGQYDLVFLVTQNGFAGDFNLQKNSVTQKVKIFNGPDLSVLAFDVNSQRAHQGEVIRVNARIVNLGDKPASDFISRVYLNDSFFSQTSIASLAANSVYTYSIDVNLPYIQMLNSIRISVDDANNVLESNENNNISALSISTLSGRDLSINEFDIDVNYSFVGEPSKVSVRVNNIGDDNVGSFLVRAYLDSLSNAIYGKQIASLEMGKSVQFDFTFTPQARGISKIIVSVDSENIVAESSENNNSASKTFFIENKQAIDSNFSARTIALDVQRDCVAVFSNNNRLVSSGFDENGGIKIILFNESNVELIDRTFSKEEEVIIPGVTMRIFSLKDNIAKIFLVYQADVKMLYNSCEVDIATMRDELNKYKGMYNDCQKSIDEKQQIVTEARSDLIVANTSLSEVTTSLSTCNTAKTETELQYNRVKDGCDSRAANITDNLNMQCNNDKARMQADYNNTLTVYFQKASDSEFLANISMTAFGLLIMSACAALLWKKKVESGVQ